MFEQDIPEGMNTEEFALAIYSMVQGLIRAGGDVIALVAPTKHGDIPIGVVGVTRGHGAVWPHVIWFPEASARNKIECAVQFLVNLKKEAQVLIIARNQDNGFFSHISKYGVIRPVGNLRGFYGDNATLYHSVN